MKSLLIETSTEEGICALYSSQDLLFLSDRLNGYKHSRNLISEIERGLSEQGLKTQDLKFIAIGSGPGSYTGLRVGAMTVMTLSWVSKVPLIAVSALEGIALEGDGPFIAALDAKIAGAYVLIGQKTGERIEFSSPEVLTLEALSLRLEGPMPLLSPHAKILEKKWSDKNLRGDVRFVEKSIDPNLLIKRACALYAQGKTLDHETLKIQYLRSVF